MAFGQDSPTTRHPQGPSSLTPLPSPLSCEQGAWWRRGRQQDEGERAPYLAVFA